MPERNPEQRDGTDESVASRRPLGSGVVPHTTVRPRYLLGFGGYVGAILGSYHFFGVGVAGVAGVAGVVAPAIRFLVDGFVAGSEDPETDDPAQSHQEQSPFVETIDQRKQRAKDRLDDHLTLRETTDGGIEVHLDAGTIDDPDRAAMLYLFGEWARAEADPEATPVVTKREIRENTSLRGRAVGVFLRKMGYFLETNYPEDPMEQLEMDEAAMAVEVDEDYLEEIVAYVLGERRSPN